MDSRHIQFGIRYLTALSFILAALVSTISFSPVSASNSRQADFGNRLDTFLLTQMETYKIPGLAVAVVRNGKVEHIKGYGVANPSGDQITTDTPFLLASVSKSFTALAVMQLAEAGKLNLNDPVQKYLPWFQVNGEGGSEITVAHLVYQTSGFSEYDGGQMNLRPNNPDELERAIRDLDQVSLIFQPGEGWDYSNINYSLLGYLVQEISGQRYEDYIEQNIFKPIQMTDSYTSLESARMNNAARGYTFFFGSPLALDQNMPYSTAILPTAGLWASASDMSRYLLSHLDEEGELLLSAEAMKQLHSPGVEIEPGYNYAMGWFHAPNVLDPEFLQTLNTDLGPDDDLQVLWHEGDGPGYKAVVLLLPGKEFGVVLLMNTNDQTITSVYKDFAWDVTLIANGGDAFYFEPHENFVIRHSRWIAGSVALLLLLGLFRTVRAQKHDDHRGKTRAAWLILTMNFSLLAYIYLGFLPEHNASLPLLFGYSPDIGILTTLITGLSVGWILVCGWILLIARSKSANRPKLTGTKTSPGT